MTFKQTVTMMNYYDKNDYARILNGTPEEVKEWFEEHSGHLADTLRGVTGDDEGYRTVVMLMCYYDSHGLYRPHDCSAEEMKAWFGENVG